MRLCNADQNSIISMVESKTRLAVSLAKTFSNLLDDNSNFQLYMNNAFSIMNKNFFFLLKKKGSTSQSQIFSTGICKTEERVSGSSQNMEAGTLYRAVDIFGIPNLEVSNHF